jgi:hypothetical protein
MDKCAIALIAMFLFGNICGVAIMDVKRKLDDDDED